MSQMAAPVMSTAAVFVYLEPKTAIQERRSCQYQDLRTFRNQYFQLLESPEVPSERHRSRVSQKNHSPYMQFPMRPAEHSNQCCTCHLIEPRNLTKPMDHDPLNPDHRKTIPPTGELQVTSTTLATPTAENVSSKCLKRTRTCGRQVDLAKYP